MSQKILKPPVWYRNSYFWIAAALLIVSILAVVLGQNAVRDPGQKREGNLWLIYFGAFVVMLTGGWISHQQALMAYNEATDAMQPVKTLTSEADGDSEAEHAEDKEGI